MGETTRLELGQRELSEVSVVILYLLGDHEKEKSDRTCNIPFRHDPKETRESSWDTTHEFRGIPETAAESVTVAD